MSPGKIQIRPERPDHPEVVALLGALDHYLASLYAPEENHILPLAALAAPDVDFLAAWQDGRIVGCGAVRRRPGEPGTGHRPYGEIKRMMVAPAARGQGIGQRLMVALEAALARHGVTLALLETGRDQHAAVRLYEGRGYRRRSAFGAYPDNGLSLFFEKPVAP